MKITAKTARTTAEAVTAQRIEELRQKSLELLDGIITDTITAAMNNGETSVTIRTPKGYDWELIEAELRKEENGFSATRATNNSTMRIGW